jgi:uncharacterized protein (DUF983 family)
MAPEISSTPQHCPGFQQYKNLSSFECQCPECGEANEIFSDEFNKPKTCTACGKPIDFSKCTLEMTGGGGSEAR